MSMAATATKTTPTKPSNDTAPASPPEGILAELVLGDILVDESKNVRGTAAEVTEKDENLVASVKANGVLEPVFVVKRDGVEKGKGAAYELFAGYRRCEALRLAAKELGRSPENMPIRAVVFTADERKRREIALTENLQRKNMSTYATAKNIKELIDMGMSQADVASQLGKTPGTVSQYVQLLSLPRGALKELRDGRLDFTSARHLCRLQDGKLWPNVAKQEELIMGVLKDILDKGLGAAKVDEEVRYLIARETERQEEKAKAEKEKEKAEKKTKAAKDGKAAPDDEDEPVDFKTAMLDVVKEAKLKVPSETKLRMLLKDRVEQFLNARSPEKRQEHRNIAQGIALAGGIELKLDDPPSKKK